MADAGDGKENACRSIPRNTFPPVVVHRDPGSVCAYACAEESVSLLQTRKRVHIEEVGGLDDAMLSARGRNATKEQRIGYHRRRRN